MSELLDSLNWRYATKNFNPNKKLSPEQVNEIMEALRLTPSSFGLQPWKFFLVENSGLRQKLVSASWNQKQVVDASHLFVLCIPNEFGEKDVDRYIQDVATRRGVSVETLKTYRDMMVGFLQNKTPEKVKEWMTKQVYIALGNLLTVCAVMRVDACPMEGFVPSQYSEILGLESKGYTPVLVCPVGYRSDEDPLNQTQKVRRESAQVFETI